MGYETEVSEVIGPSGKTFKIRENSSGSLVAEINGDYRTTGNPLVAYQIDDSGNVIGLVEENGALIRETDTYDYARWRSMISAESTTPWDDKSGSGLTLTIDSSVLFNGRPTLRLDIPASSSGTYRVGTTGAVCMPPYNWDGKQLAVAVRSSNMTAVDGVANVFLGDASFSNFYSFTGQRNSANVPQANWVANDWMITRGTTVSTGAGSPTFTGLKRLRINFTVTSVGTPTQVWIGFVGVAAQKTPTVIVSIDDGYASGYSFVADVARYYKIPISFGIDRAYVGTTGYLTSAQILELHADPSGLFEFVTHGYNNTSLSDAGSASVYVQQQIETRAYLRSLGINGDGPNHHPWVQSIYSNDAQSLMNANGFLSARMGAATPLSMHDSFMATGDEKRVFQLCNCCTLTTGLSLAEAQTAIDSACDTEGYGVTHVNAHDFAAADAASPPTWSYDKFVDLMGWLAQKRTDGECDIKLWGQWYADIAGYKYRR